MSFHARFHVLHTDDLCEDSLNAMSSIVFQTRFVTVHVFIEHSSILRYCIQ